MQLKKNTGLDPK